MTYNEDEVHIRLQLFQGVFLEAAAMIGRASNLSNDAREAVLERTRDCIASHIEKGETDSTRLFAAVVRDVLDGVLYKGEPAAGNIYTFGFKNSGKTQH